MAEAVDPRIQALADELVVARDEFLAALGDIDPQLLTSPGLVGVWSARELVAHMGYWAGHAAEAIHLAEQDRLDEFEADVPSVDERNAVVARVAGRVGTGLGTVGGTFRAFFGFVGHAPMVRTVAAGRKRPLGVPRPRRETRFVRVP